jgi:hypothetical protein
MAKKKRRKEVYYRKWIIWDVLHPALAPVDYDESFEAKTKRLYALGKLTSFVDVFDCSTSANPAGRRKGQKEIVMGLIQGIPFSIRRGTVLPMGMSYRDLKRELVCRKYRPAAPTEFSHYLEKHSDILEKMRRREKDKRLEIFTLETVFRVETVPDVGIDLRGWDFTRLHFRNGVVYYKWDDSGRVTLDCRWVGDGWAGRPGKYFAVVVNNPSNLDFPKAVR